MSYETVLRYIEENGYEIAGKIRESSIDGVWNKEDESHWLSEIQVPVRRKPGSFSLKKGKILVFTGVFRSGKSRTVSLSGQVLIHENKSFPFLESSCCVLTEAF